MSYEHDYYSDQCAGCKWAEWRGGCLNKATADDGSDLDAADRGECKHFEAGQPQKRPPQPGDRVYVHIPLAEYDSLRARAEAAEQRAEAAERELAQAQAERDEAAATAGFAAAIARTAQAEAERLRSAIAETLRLADIYAGVAAHNAEAEPETAGEAWRSPYMATMRELRRALRTAP